MLSGPARMRTLPGERNSRSDATSSRDGGSAHSNWNIPSAEMRAPLVSELARSAAATRNHEKLEAELYVPRGNSGKFDEAPRVVVQQDTAAASNGMSASVQKRQGTQSIGAGVRELTKRSTRSLNRIFAIAPNFPASFCRHCDIARDR